MIATNNDGPTWEKLVEVSGSPEKAMEMLRRVYNAKPPAPLTPLQAKVLDYLDSGKPRITLRQVSAEVGIDHPYKLVSVMAALVMKGYLVPNKSPLDKDSSV